MALRQLNEKMMAIAGADLTGGRSGIDPKASTVLQEVFYDLGLGLRCVRTKIEDHFKKTVDNSRIDNCICMNCSQEGAPPIQMTPDAYEGAKASAKRMGHLAVVKDLNNPNSIKAEDKLINWLFDTCILNGDGIRSNPATIPADIAWAFEDH